MITKRDSITVFTESIMCYRVKIGILKLIFSTMSYNKFFRYTRSEWSRLSLISKSDFTFMTVVIFTRHHIYISTRSTMLSFSITIETLMEVFKFMCLTNNSIRYVFTSLTSPIPFVTRITFNTS